MVEYYAYAGMLGLENHCKLMEDNDLELIMELPTYVKRLERNNKKTKRDWKKQT